MVSLPPWPPPSPTQALPCCFPGAQAGERGRGRARTIQQPLTAPCLHPSSPLGARPYLCTWTSTATPCSPSPGECSTLTTVSRKVTLILRSTEGWEAVSGQLGQQEVGRVSQLGRPCGHPAVWGPRLVGYGGVDSRIPTRGLFTSLNGLGKHFQALQGLWWLRGLGEPIPEALLSQLQARGHA